jgi:hypothetical protein
MKAKMLEDKYILGRMAIFGQFTVFYAKPNAGKTLLVLWMLIEAIKRGNIKGEEVYYINADDNHKGITHKLALAEKVGFKMLVPGYHGLEANMLPEILSQMIKAEIVSGKVLILDTLKKFTDIMDKRAATDFAETVRQFVAKGGSSIGLAHVNKHDDVDGNVVYAGTTDIVDDADCCYTLQVLEENSEQKAVVFTNFKNRGDVAKKVLFAYSNAEDVLYDDLLASVYEMDTDESNRISARAFTRAKLEKNQHIIEEIKVAISGGIVNKTELVAEVREATGESKKRVIQVLADHTGTNVKHGQLWTVETGYKHRHAYQLNEIFSPPEQGRD